MIIITVLCIIHNNNRGITRQTGGRGESMKKEREKMIATVEFESKLSATTYVGKQDIYIIKNVDLNNQMSSNINGYGYGYEKAVTES